MYYLILSFILCYSLLFYLRKVYFFRSFTVNRIDPGIYSPCCGTVVYIKDTDNIYKGDRVFRIEIPNDTLQIGIFMSQYDNHHYTCPMHPSIKATSYGMYGNDNPSPMQTYIDSILSFLFINYYNWNDRSKVFISSNQQYCITYPNKVVSIITMDKFVNAVSESTNPNFDLIVHRGSQTDIFIPKSLITSIKIKVGDHVDFNSIIS